MSTQNLAELWLDRDLTWLEFNRRVLAEALDERTPLLERLKFLAIFTSNLDEFFMKRIAVLRVENNGTHTKLLADLRAVVVGMVQQQQACFTALLPRLEQHGVRLLGWKDLSDRQRVEATKFFQQNVLPALTPLVVDSAHPTPFLSNLSLSWVCRLREPGSEGPLYGRVKVATGLPPWIQVREESSTGSRWFINLTELVRQHLSDLFPGLETYDHTLLRITRDAEVEWHGDSSESVREVVAERVRLRRYEPAVRIEFGPEALVSASRGGLPIDLVVRGFCCLRPGVPGPTETIRVRSIIGRFLEHARIFYFANGASDPSSGDFYIGSADWMERNLSWRVEVVAPVVAPALRQRLWEILDINLSDCRQAWMMTASGEYRRLEPGPKARGAALDGTHATLMHLTAALATTQTAVVRELQVNRGPGFFFADPGSNASAADVILEERKLT